MQSRMAVITYMDGGEPGRPDNTLPGGAPGYPSHGLPPGAVTLPVFPFDPTMPDNSLPGAPGHPSTGLPGSPGHPSTGLPGSPGHPSTGLPGSPAYPSQPIAPGGRFVVKWLDWALVRAATHEPAGLSYDDFIVWEEVPNRRCLDAARIWSDYPR